MMAERVDRKQLKAEARELLAAAQVSPKGMAALFLGLGLLLSFVDQFTNNVTGGFPNPLGLFVTILTSFLGAVLGVGFILYCMAIRRGERAEYLTLFDGFSFVGKIIVLELVMSLFISLWSMLFVIPGIVAAYRYRFAVYNLCENPGIGVMEALDMSKRQTWGYKGQLFVLDGSCWPRSPLLSLRDIWSQPPSWLCTAETMPPGCCCICTQGSSLCGRFWPVRGLLRCPSSTAPATSAWSWGTLRSPSAPPAWG